MSAVKDNDSDALAKANKGAVGKVIAAILVFLIPTFVNLISNISSFDSDNYLSCMDMATKEGINTARLNYASNRIENLKEN
jgi:hypothetical protein